MDSPQSLETRKIGWKKTILFSLLPLVILLGLSEGAARILERWFPPAPIDFGNGFDSNTRLFIPDENTPGTLITNPRKRRTFETHSFKDPKPQGTLRIVVIGESSIARLDEELQAMAARMQRSVGPSGPVIEVLNAGGRAYGSQRLLIVATEMAAYQPDAVVVYMGHNEFEEVEQLVVTFPETSALQESLAGSALVRLSRDRLLAFQLRLLQDDHNKRILSRQRPSHARAWKYKFTREDVETRMTAFRGNLQHIVQLFKQGGVPVIIGTIPSNLVKPYLPEEAQASYAPVWQLLEQRKYAEAEALGKQVLRDAVGRHQSSPRENEIIRAIAADNQLPVADVEAVITRAEPHGVPGETLFSDHCHLNAEGNKILAATLEEKLREVLKLGSVNAPVPSLPRQEGAHQP